MALRKLFHFSTPHFLHLYNGPNSGDCCEDWETVYRLPSIVSNTQSVLSISGNDHHHYHKTRCWERLKAGGEGDDRGWDGWMASPTQWTWVWASSRSWWWTRRPGVLQSVGSQRVRHDWATELNWTGMRGAARLLLRGTKFLFRGWKYSKMDYCDGWLILRIY